MYFGSQIRVWKNQIRAMVTNSVSSLNESSILIAPIEKVLPVVAVIYACWLRAQIFEVGGGMEIFPLHA